jgi:hypothetical protein
MNAPTYGDHAEAVADALRELLVSDTIPASPDEVAVLLACREAVIDAMRERLDLFDLTPGHRPRNFDRHAGLRALAHVDQELSSLLDRVVYEMPRLVPDGDGMRPSDLLGPRQVDRTVELWRRAAVELLAGNHALATTEDPTWSRDPGAGWYALRDLAGAVEATVVLDHRLRQVGLLSQHDRTPDTGPVDEHRLIASQLGRVATWYATNSSPDQATPHIVDNRELHFGPVYLVSTPSDLIGAQRRLASYVRPIHASNSAYTGEPLISAGTARHLVSSQLFLTGLFADIARTHPRASVLTEDFRIRAELLQIIQPRLRYLEDIRSHQVDHLPRNQQGEITYAVRRMIRDGKPFALSGAQVLDLANATHEVNLHFATSLRRELARADSNLGLAHPIHKTRILQVGQKSPLDNALRDLIHVPAPAIPVTEFSSPLQRAALRGTLELTPTEGRIPCPYPAGMKPSTPPGPNP